MHRLSLDHERPSQWYLNFAARKQLAEHDRTYLELKTLFDIVQAAGEYEHAGLGGLPSLEHVTRRITAIVGTLSRGAASQNWGQAEDIQGWPRMDSSVD